MGSHGLRVALLDRHPPDVIGRTRLTPISPAGRQGYSVRSGGNHRTVQTSVLPVADRRLAHLSSFVSDTHSARRQHHRRILAAHAQGGLEGEATVDGCRPVQ